MPALPKRQAVNLALIAAAVALLIVVLVTSGRVTTGEQTARENNVLPAFREDDITRLVLERGGKRVVLERVKSGDAGDSTWNLLEPVKEEADVYGVDKLLGSLEFARIVRRIKPE